MSSFKQKVKAAYLARKEGKKPKANDDADDGWDETTVQKTGSQTQDNSGWDTQSQDTQPQCATAQDDGWKDTPPQQKTGSYTQDSGGWDAPQNW